MTALALRTFADRWQLFIGTILALSCGVSIVHASLSILFAVADFSAMDTAVQGARSLGSMSLTLGGFLTIFVVGSTFGFAIDQRIRDIALLRLVGVTAKQLRRLLFAEAVVTAIFGAFIGVLLGFPLTELQKALFLRLGAYPVEAQLSWHLLVLIIDFAAAIIVAVAGAWAPIQRTTKTNLLNPTQERTLMTRARWLTAIAASTLTIVQVGLSISIPNMVVALSLGIGIIVSSAVALNRFSPLLVPLVAAVVTRLSPSALTHTAIAHLQDAVRRTASCAAPMIVLIGLAVGMQGLMNTQSEAMRQTTWNDADLIATGSNLDLPTIESLAGVLVAAPETVVDMKVQATDYGEPIESVAQVVAVDPADFAKVHTAPVKSGSLSDFGPNTIVIGPLADLSHGGSLTVVGAGQRLELKEAARFGIDLGATDGYFIDRNSLDPALLSGTTRVLLQLTPQTDLGLVTQQLYDAGAESVFSPAEYAQHTSKRQSNLNTGVVVAIAGLGSIYALISVLSTLAIAISQRRGEFATLRLTGLTNRQVLRLSLLESLVATAIGLGLGALAAISAQVGLWVSTARTYGFPIVEIPWALLAIMSIVVVGLVISTVWIATRSAIKPPAIAALGS